MGRPVRDICPGGFLPVSLPPVRSGQGWVGAGPPGLQAPWALGDPAGTDGRLRFAGRSGSTVFLPSRPRCSSVSGVTFMAAGSSLGALGSRGAWTQVSTRVTHPPRAVTGKSAWGLLLTTVSLGLLRCPLAGFMGLHGING